MSKTDKQKQTQPAKPRKPRTKKASAGITSKKSPRKKTTSRKRGKKKPPRLSRQTVLLTTLETVCLICTAATGVAVVLGLASSRFSGSHFFNHLLPFLLGVLGLITLFALLLVGWIKARRRLLAWWPFLPALLALALAASVGTLALKGDLFFAFNQFRILVGGKDEAARVTLAHQVFAAYRRLDTTQLTTLIIRAQPYSKDIDEAAAAFRLDPDLLHGVAATESSFLPRDSEDGGKGLFQITQIPDEAVRMAARKMGVETTDVANHRHNCFLAAATLSYYLRQMRGDLFLGLLAYNIGPANGGLRFIMQQYGATSFVTVQPYLQQLPRDYPIRALSQALAFRLYRKEGRLPAYEDKLNAVRIQHIGIPGL